MVLSNSLAGQFGSRKTFCELVVSCHSACQHPDKSMFKMSVINEEFNMEVTKRVQWVAKKKISIVTCKIIKTNKLDT